MTSKTAFRPDFGHNFIRFDDQRDPLAQIDQIVERAQSYATHKVDQTAAAKEIAFSAHPDNQTDALLMTLPRANFGALPPLEIETYAARQLYARCAPFVFGKGTAKVLPFDYLQAMPPALRAHVISDHVSHANGTRWMVRGYQDPNSAPTARAIVGEGYATIDNMEIVDLTAEIVREQSKTLDSLRIARAAVQRDYLNLQIAFRDVTVREPDGDQPRGNGGGYAIGVYIGNSEIGDRKLRALPFVMRTSCTNSTIFDQGQGVEFMHVGSKRSKLALFTASVIEALQGTGELLDKMIAAQGEIVPDFTHVLQGLALRYNWTQDQATAIAAGTENSQTRWGVVQGVAYAANAESDPNAAADLQTLSGRLLVAPGTLFAEAARMARAEIARAEVIR